MPIAAGCWAGGSGSLWYKARPHSVTVVLGLSAAVDALNCGCGSGLRVAGFAGGALGGAALLAAQWHLVVVLFGVVCGVAGDGVE